MARPPVPGLCLVAFCALMPRRAGWSAETVPAGYQVVAEELGIPATVLHAVALTQSGRPKLSAGIDRPSPWTLNVAGRGYFFDFRQAAWQALVDWLGSGKRSIDVA